MHFCMSTMRQARRNAEAHGAISNDMTLTRWRLRRAHDGFPATLNFRCNADENPPKSRRGNIARSRRCKGAIPKNVRRFGIRAQPIRACAHARLGLRLSSRVAAVSGTKERAVRGAGRLSRELREIDWKDRSNQYKIAASMGKPPYKLSSVLLGHSADVRAVATFLDGTVVSVSRDKTARVWKPTGLVAHVIFSCPRKSADVRIPRFRTTFDPFRSSKRSDTFLCVREVKHTRTWIRSLTEC